MTDMHAACSSLPQAHKEFEALCLKFADLMNDIIAKERSEENSRYVITEVVNDGYTYKKSILRRASVIVTTQSEEMEKWAE